MFNYRKLPVEIHFRSQQSKAMLVNLRIFQELSVDIYLYMTLNFVMFDSFTIN